MFFDWRALRAFNRDTYVFLMVCALDAFGYFGIQAVLFNLCLLRLGFDPAFIGLLIASGQVLSAIAALPAGAIGQRLGLRTTLIMSSGLAALGMGLLLLVEALPRTLWSFWLFACCAILWIGTALYSVNCPPYLMQVTTRETRNHAFAAQGALLAFMGFAGSFVAGLLPTLLASWTCSSPDSPSLYRHVLWIAPLSYLLCALLWAIARPVQMMKTPETVSAPSKPIGLFIFQVLIVFLQTASEGALSFFNIYLDAHLGVPTIRAGFGMGKYRCHGWLSDRASRFQDAVFDQCGISTCSSRLAVGIHAPARTLVQCFSNTVDRYSICIKEVIYVYAHNRWRSRGTDQSRPQPIR